jgi:DNA polymerase phi
MSQEPPESAESTDGQAATTTGQATKSPILNHFWSLASVDISVREQASKELISHFTKLIINSDKLTTLEEIKTKCHQDVSYSLKRLLRGLSSSRDGAREGFATCLTKLLELLNIDADLIVTLLFEISEKNGTKTGQEERELYYARIFGVNAFCLAGRFNDAKLETIEKVSTALVEYQVKKDYLRQAVSLVLYNLLVACKHDDNQTIAILTAYLKTGIATPEQVWFVVKAKELQLKSLDALISTEWKKSNVLCLKNKTKLFDILFGATYHNNALHPVYPTIIQALVKKTESTSMSLFDFWAGIEDSYFSSSHDRKNMGFFIFEEILPLVNDNVALIFTPHFMRCLINSLSSKVISTSLNPRMHF